MYSFCLFNPENAVALKLKKKNRKNKFGKNRTETKTRRENESNEFAIKIWKTEGCHLRGIKKTTD